MYRKQVWNKSQTYFDGRFNSGAFFIYLTVRPSTDGKRAPLTAINPQAAGSPQQAPPTYIAKMWKLIKFRKNVIFSRNHTDVNPDDWTITKKTIRTTIHENFSKMKNLKVDRWALSLSKVIDYIILERHSDDLKTAHLLFAYNKEHSTTMCTAMIKEVVARYT